MVAVGAILQKAFMEQTKLAQRLLLHSVDVESPWKSPKQESEFDLAHKSSLRWKFYRKWGVHLNLR